MLCPKKPSSAGSHAGSALAVASTAVSKSVMPGYALPVGQVLATGSWTPYTCMVGDRCLVHEPASPTKNQPHDPE